MTAAAATGSDALGQSAALTGGTAVLGAPSDDEPGVVDAGATYVYVVAAGTWSLQARLVAADARSYDYMGESVALNGDQLLAGARSAALPGGSAGAAYVFVRGGATWTQQAKLEPADGVIGDRFGRYVALAGGCFWSTAWPGQGQLCFPRVLPPTLTARVVWTSMIWVTSSVPAASGKVRDAEAGARRNPDDRDALAEVLQAVARVACG